MEQQNKNEYALWIDSLLTIGGENPNQNVIELLCKCGGACAKRKGWDENMRQLGQSMPHFDTRCDCVKFLNEMIPSRFEEADDGIIQHLGNTSCNCPLSEKINNPVLCHCSQGNSRAMWSAFFGKPVEIEIVETILRGGKECAFKIKP